MLDHKVIAVHHDPDNGITVGYGADCESALKDLEAILDGEFFDPKMVTFYSKMPTKIKMVLED